MKTMNMKKKMMKVCHMFGVFGAMLVFAVLSVQLLLNFCSVCTGVNVSYILKLSSRYVKEGVAKSSN